MLPANISCKDLSLHVRVRQQHLFNSTVVHAQDPPPLGKEHADRRECCGSRGVRHFLWAPVSAARAPQGAPHARELVGTAGISHANVHRLRLHPVRNASHICKPAPVTYACVDTAVSGDNARIGRPPAADPRRVPAPGVVRG